MEEQDYRSLNTEESLSSARLLNTAPSKGTQKHTALGDGRTDGKQDFKTVTNEPV